MAESKSLKHALHNEEVCLFINGSKKFDDWVITTSLYSALHFMHHKLFPIKIQVKGKDEVADSFSSYCSKTDKLNQKHKVMRELVENYCSADISATYNNMLDMCWSARYSNYKFSKEITKLALRRLTVIKNYCTK